MISNLFNITEEQLTWIRQKAIVNQSTSSAVLRRVLREAMEREGVVLSLMKLNDDSTTILSQNTK
jgi:hypothetical protein